MSVYRTVCDQLQKGLEDIIHEAQRHRVARPSPPARRSFLDTALRAVNGVGWSKELPLQYATQVVGWDDAMLPGILIQVSAPAALTRVAVVRRLELKELYAAPSPAVAIINALCEADWELGEKLKESM